MQQRDPNFRGLSDKQSYLSRGSPFNNLGTGYHSDLIVITEGGQHTHPYILDWYYTAMPQGTIDKDGDIRSQYFDSVVEHSKLHTKNKAGRTCDMAEHRVNLRLQRQHLYFMNLSGKIMTQTRWPTLLIDIGGQGVHCTVLTQRRAFLSHQISKQKDANFMTITLIMQAQKNPWIGGIQTGCQGRS